MADKKIRILETIRQGKVGGGETHVLELCTHIDKTRFEPVVLSFTNGPMVDELRKRGIRTEVIYTEQGFDWKIWKQVSEFIKTNDFDIIHAHGTRAMSNVMFPTRAAKIPLLYTVHGWSFHPDQYIHERKIRETSEWLMTRIATRTICVSASNENEGKKRFGLKNSEMIYNAVDLQKFDPKLHFKDIRQELGITSDIVVIGYIVRITIQKDPFTMIRAMKEIISEHPKVLLLVVGEGDLKSQAIQLAYELNIQNKIIFLPFRSDIPDILNAIDIYCLPSLWEGFPIGILEAMAMKRCVISSPVDGNPEIVHDGKTGLLVPVQQPSALAQALLRVIKQKDERDQLATNAYKFIAQDFGIESMVKKVEQLYLKVIDSK